MVERDGNNYPFNTEVIYAGGYNIQKLHFRYLTKTTLPQTGQSTETQKLKAELVKMGKGEKLQKDIERLKKRIELNQKEIDANSKFNDKQILDKVNAGDNVAGKPFVWPSWEEIVKRGADKNYNNDEKYYNQRKKESEDGSIEFWKKKNITWKQQDIASSKKEIEKTQKKLDNL
jgi:hypothetical protein